MREETKLKKTDKIILKTFFIKPTKRLIQKIEKNKIKKEIKKIKNQHEKLNKALIKFGEIYEILNDKEEVMTEEEIMMMPLNESIETMTELIKDLEKKI